MLALSGPRQLELPLQQAGLIMKSPKQGSGGGQAGIDPQTGEGTAGGPTWESLGTEGRHLLLVSWSPSGR